MLIDEADSPIARLLLAHGAGAGMDTPVLTDMARALRDRGLTVVRFEFPYMRAQRETGRRCPPDRMPILEGAFKQRIAETSRELPLFIAGKSMGGRVATRIADQVEVKGAIALGYPFHPPKAPGKLRVEHLTMLQTPCLIVQGTRDPFGTPEEVAGYALSQRVQLHWLTDGDHSFAPRKASGRTLAQNIEEACDVMKRFVVSALTLITVIMVGCGGETSTRCPCAADAMVELDGAAGDDQRLPDASELHDSQQPTDDAAAAGDGAPEPGFMDGSQVVLDGALQDGAAERDAQLVPDAESFTSEECDSCMRIRGSTPFCEAPHLPVTWTCDVSLPAVQQRLRERCVDSASSAIRYCCPDSFAPECSR